jgi:hypothetical protein
MGTEMMMLVADHEDGVTIVPLRVTVLVPFVAPKLLPVIVTCTLVGVGTTVGTPGVGTSKSTSAEFALIDPEVLYDWTTK